MGLPSTTARRARPRPSRVLPLDRRPPARPSPTDEEDDAATRGRRARTAVVAVVALVLLALGGTRALGPADPPGPAPITDIATEDAVVALLRLWSAEAALAAAPAVAGGPFTLPGAGARAAAIDAALPEASRVLAETREAGIAPGTPGLTYAADADHDLLLELAAGVRQRTADLAALEASHATRFAGAGIATPESTAATITALRARPAAPEALAWAAAIEAGDPAAATAARAAAAAAWQAEAGRLAPAATDLLSEFLNGIDPGVIAALDGHPTAGPALTALRR